ncbi:MAG: ankyrin repeat domain-containing protein [Steroidobacteraceae bacterium]
MKSAFLATVLCAPWIANAATPDVGQLLQAGDRDGALAALTAGADARSASVDGTTPLHWAAHNGDEELTRALLKAGADANAHNTFGATPMSAAAELGNAPILELLLRAGADVESANAEGQTALMAVARTGRVDAAQVLLKHGAKVDARETWGEQTALMWAAAQSNPDMVRVLLKHRADPNARAKAREWERRVTAEPRPKDMHRGGLTPLLYAAREGCLDCASELLKGGASIDLGDPDGVTPLILALINGRWDMAKLLVERGADVNLWDFYGRAPLYAAVDMNTLPVGKRIELPSSDKTSGLELVTMLLDRGANPNAQLKLRVPHRQVAYDRYTEPMLNIGATPLLRASKAGDVAVVKLLLAHGALPDLANMNGDTPLMAAVGKGWVSVPTRGANYTEDQALEVYALLRGAGADVRARTNFNETALHNAALRGWPRIIRKLIEDGADPDAMDRNNLTPIDFAMVRIPKGFNEVHPQPREETVALLRSLGAKLEHPDTPPWPPGSTPRITARVPSDTTVLPPF